MSRFDEGSAGLPPAARTDPSPGLDEQSGEQPAAPPADPAASRALAAALGAQLIRLFRLIERTHPAPAAGSDILDRPDYLLLAHVIRTGPQRAGALAEAIHSDPSTVSRQVAKLVRLGLLERRADPADGRACVLAPTGTGVARFDRAREQRTGHLARILAGWSHEDQRHLIELLDRLGTDFERHRPQLAGPPRARGER